MGKIPAQTHSATPSSYLRISILIGSSAKNTVSRAQSCWGTGVGFPHPKEGKKARGATGPGSMEPRGIHFAKEIQVYYGSHSHTGTSPSLFHPNG